MRLPARTHPQETHALKSSLEIRGLNYGSELQDTLHCQFNFSKVKQSISAGQHRQSHNTARPD
jgi:hypothetical protein